MSKNFNAFDLLVMAERRYGEPEFMLTRNLWYDTFDKLKIDKKPTVQELEEFFSQPPYGFSTIFHSLKLKYRALTTEPSAIEKTMTPYQLFVANSPFWTNKLTAEEADAILMRTVGTCTLTEEEFNDRYQKALAGELIKKPIDPLLWYQKGKKYNAPVLQSTV